jgi:hypothetical protein
MRVKRLFVIAVFSDDENSEEIIGNAKELWFKYSAHASSGRLFHVHVDCKSVDRMITLDKSKLTISMKAEIGDVSTSESDTGIYIVAHGYDLTISACKLAPEAMAELIPHLAISQIRKACLIICRSDSNQRTRDDVKAVYGNLTFLTAFCVKLEDYKLTPMIAGWERFITICRPGMEEDDKPVTGEDGKAAFAKGDLEKLYGKKYQKIHQGICFHVWCDHRSGMAKNVINTKLHEMKHVYQYRDDGAVVVTEGWTDKTK